MPSWHSSEKVIATSTFLYRILKMLYRISKIEHAFNLCFRGMHKLIGQYTSFGISEVYRGIFIAAQVKQLRRYVPELRFRDVKRYVLHPGVYIIFRGLTGVRAQALGPDGALIEDFIFDGGEGELGSRVLHVRNAPSPGATSSLAIARMITQKASEKFNIGSIDSHVNVGEAPSAAKSSSIRG